MNTNIISKSLPQLVSEYKSYVINYCKLNNIEYEVISYYDYDFAKNFEIILVDDDYEPSIKNDLRKLYPMFRVFCIKAMSLKGLYVGFE